MSDTVNHGILLKKFEHYGVRRHAFKWFTPYLTSRKQYTKVNNIDFQISYISYGAPQGSVLGLLLLLIYINDLNRAVTFSYIQHFADDTNIIYRHKPLRKINQRISYDLRNIVEWLKANRIALNTDQTRTVLFRAPRKPLTRKVNFRTSGQRIKVKTCAKYLELIIDEFLNWKSHFNVLRTNLGRSTGLVSKIRYFVSVNLLRTIYFAIFNSYLHYGFQVWGQNKNASTKEIALIQDKALRIMSFKDRNAATGPLYHKKKIIKFF